MAGLATASLAVTATSCGGGGTTGSFDDTVTVGILHSLSGTMAISESTLVDTEKMAIEEINAAGFNKKLRLIQNESSLVNNF